MVVAAVEVASTTMDPSLGGGSPRRCGGIKRKSPFTECTDSKEGSLLSGSGDGTLTAKNNESSPCQDEESRNGNDNKGANNVKPHGNSDGKGGGVCPGVNEVSESALSAAPDHPPSTTDAPQAENKNVNGGKNIVASVVERRGARDISEYKIIGPVGEGTYGLVWKAVPPSKTGKTNEIVALKMIKTTELNTAAPRPGQNTSSSKVPDSAVSKCTCMMLICHCLRVESLIYTPVAVEMIVCLIILSLSRSQQLPQTISGFKIAKDSCEIHP